MPARWMNHVIPKWTQYIDEAEYAKSSRLNGPYCRTDNDVIRGGMGVGDGGPGIRFGAR